MEVIRTKKSWDSILGKVDSYDFYHTYDYHELSKKEIEEPILIVYSEAEKIIAIPFLLRRIFDTEYYDLTSVYGYSGPLVKNINKIFDNFQFQTEFQTLLHSLKIVSVFSRLHPFMKQQSQILKNIGEIKQLGSVVNIDLTKDITEQRIAFSRATKRYINKTRKVCLVKKDVVNEQVMDVFLDLYYENMDRVDAHDSYYFSKDYLMNFVNAKDFETEVLFAVLEETNKVISAAMMVKTNNIIQYHISGTRNDFLHLTPIRILIDEMRIMGTEQGYKYFNLGGGLGSAEDSLFDFKASFSKDFREFEIWKYIVNDSVYNSLVDESSTSENQEFFPLYRANYGSCVK